jgi:cytochrome b561
MSGDCLYNWHKSLGLAALALAMARLWSRRAGVLPPWAPGLSAFERRLIHRYEQALYAAMFVMPLSGFVYVMAGGYGVLLFGLWPLPDPIGEWKALAAAARVVHAAAAIILAAAIAIHAGLVLRHQFILRDGLLSRML